MDARRFCIILKHDKKIYIYKIQAAVGRIHAHWGIAQQKLRFRRVPCKTA